MDISKLIEQKKYLKVEDVKASESKTIQFMNKGAMKTGDYGEYTEFEVRFVDSNEILLWTPFAPALRAIAEQYGAETNNWVGKPVILGTGLNKNDKEIIEVLPSTVEESRIEA